MLVNRIITDDVHYRGMTVQNEPEYAAPWEACAYTAEQERDFIRDFLGPQMAADHPGFNLVVYDHNKDHIHHWANVTFSVHSIPSLISATIIIWSNACFIMIW